MGSGSIDFFTGWLLGLYQGNLLKFKCFTPGNRINRGWALPAKSSLNPRRFGNDAEGAGRSGRWFRSVR